MAFTREDAPASSAASLCWPIAGERVSFEYVDLGSLGGLLRREVGCGMFELARSDKGERGGVHQS